MSRFRTEIDNETQCDTYTALRYDPQNMPWASLHTDNPNLPSYEITEQSVSIGRGKNCTIIVQDKRISSVHCVITRTADSLSAIIEDRRFYSLLLPCLPIPPTSSNGTFINNEKVLISTFLLILLSRLAKEKPDC